MSSTLRAAGATDAEAIRRTFARAWGEIGASWGVAPSTATVQGYLLAHGGPLTEPELRHALEISHRAASLALAQCEEWGLIERAEGPRRSGHRGPAAVAWTMIGDHWEWFRRVAQARRIRETAPVVPIIERCVALAAAEPGDPELADLRERLAGLLEFVRSFDRGVAMVVSGPPSSIERLFATIDHLDDATGQRLWNLVNELTTDEMTRALEALANLPPSATRRLIGLADQPVLRKLLGL